MTGARSDRWVRITAVASVLMVSGVAAIVSYAHMHDLAREHGEQWRATLIPLAVDGMLIAATLAIVTQRRDRRPVGWVPWFGLFLGIVASLAANVAAAQPDVIARVVAAWPPVALAVSIETLVIILRVTAATAPEPVAEPDAAAEQVVEPGDELTAQIVQHITEAQRDGHPAPGRRRLARLTGAKEHEVRAVLPAALSTVGSIQ